ncbi:MAG: hypothetical protein IJP68_07955 [Selenomonadaceae bacterium]|nr:hypothetical protein [Selenomonadaceae bacterium]
MSWKKILCGALAASMIFSASMFCAAEESANAKLARIEIDTYGTEQSGALLDRISRLEKSYSGQNMEGNMNARIEAIYDTLYDNSAEPGILAKVNVLEWNINHEVASSGIDLRLTALENQILGATSEGTFNERIRELAKATYGEETLPLIQVQIPANTLIKVETTAPVSSKVMQEGDVIPVKVVEDIFVDDALVFAKGLPGEGVITRVVRAKNIFSNGKGETDFNMLNSIDGQDVKTFTGIEALEVMDTNSMSRGLSLIGQTFSGKSKAVEEVFIRGKNIELPAGVELYVQIKSPVVVYGLRQNNSPTSFVVDTPAPQVVDKPSVAPTIVDKPKPEPADKPKTETPAEEQSDLRLAEDERGDVVKDTKPAETKPAETKPAPTDTPDVETRPDEGKTLEGNDGEIIEIFDEE